MAQSLTAERETHLNMTGDNHNEWDAFSDGSGALKNWASNRIVNQARAGSIVLI